MLLKGTINIFFLFCSIFTKTLKLDFELFCFETNQNSKYKPVWLFIFPKVMFVNMKQRVKKPFTAPTVCNVFHCVSPESRFHFVVLFSYSGTTPLFTFGLRL